MKEKQGFWIGMAITIIVIIIVACLLGEKELSNGNLSDIVKGKSKTIRIISSSENQDLEQVIEDYAAKNGYNIQIEYDGTLNIIDRLNQGENFDAVWLSNSIWQYMLNSSVKVSDSKYTSINPVIFGITKKKAEELGFVGKKVYTKDIVTAIASGNLKFSMSNPTKTNSGASAYLGLLSTLAGNPEVLTKETLDNEKLKENLVTLFSGLERSSGSEDFLEELFLNGDYEAVVTYESSIINMNKKLENAGKDTLYAIYPVDGVSISDSPFAYIDNGDESKKEIFKNLQSFILSDEGQALLQQKGRRTWYGGISNNVDKTIFNPEWGIETTKYISPIKYPNTNVIKLALNMYQTELRKPTHVVFCLDYSGSMTGDGYKQLINAMQYILTDEASKDLLQFSYKDKITVIPFSSNVIDIWNTEDGSKTEEIVNKIKALTPKGMTALYPASVEALKQLEKEDADKYNLSVILMTDGLGNAGTYNDLRYAYKATSKIPIYSIMFGSAEENQLEQIAELTNGKVFDGRTSLLSAFKEVRGYN